MDPNVLHLVVAGVLTLVFVVITALIWSRAQVKTVFWWIGLTLLPLGVYFLGLGPAVTGAWETLRDWAIGLQLTPMVWVGVALATLSVLLMLGSRLIPSESFRDRRALAKDKRKQEASAAKPAVAGRPAAPAPSPSRPASAPAKAPSGQAAGDAEFDEIAELLRKRGIN
ncbi:MAG: hypothetical protein Q4F65_03755 [Propionibacteriaceae bacterium]|nr:hypothetical protein [Propionibacteriaceae bacterium]